MKKIITTILIFVPLFLMAQTAPPIFQGSKYYEFRNAVRVDSAFFIPRKDTLFFDNTLKAPGMLTWRPADSTIYMYRGDRWISILSSSNPGLSLDSARRSNDTLFFRYTTGGELAVKMDYYTKEESDSLYTITGSNGITVVNRDVQLGGTFGDDGNDISVLGHDGKALYLRGTSGTDFATDLSTSELRLRATGLRLQQIDRTGGLSATFSHTYNSVDFTGTAPVNYFINNGSISRLNISGDSIRLLSPLISIQGPIQSNNLRNNVSVDSILYTDSDGYIKQRLLTVSDISDISDSLRKAGNGLYKDVDSIKLGGGLTESTNIRLDNYNLRFLNSRPVFLEFKRNPSVAWDSAVGTVGALGNPEMNMAFNMDYTDGVHRLYDKTQGAMWFALGGQAGAIQWAAPTHISTDVWTASGSQYVMSFYTDAGDSKIGFNSSVGIPHGDGNVMIRRTASQASLTGSTDLVLAGHRTKGTAGDVSINPYDTGKVYIGLGGGKTYMGFLGASSAGDGILTVARSGANPSITGSTVLILEGNRLKGAAGDVYVNSYNAGNIYLALGGGKTSVGGGIAAIEKLSVNGNIETRSTGTYLSSATGGYVAFKDINGVTMGSVGDGSSQDRSIYLNNTIGTKTKFINMPDTAAPGNAFSYVSIIIDSLRNVGIGDTLAPARLSVGGTVKLGIPGAARWDIYYRDSTTTFLTPLSAGTYGQYYRAGPGGKPEMHTLVAADIPALPFSQITGTVPITQGGTGLTSLGTTLQQIRVNAGATALEYFTPSVASTPTLDAVLISGNSSTQPISSVQSITTTGTSNFNSNIVVAGVGSFGIGVKTDTLKATGSVMLPIRTVTGNTTLNASDYTVVVNNTGVATITLPAAASSVSRIYIIKKTSAALNNVIIDPDGTELIDGSALNTLTLQYSSIVIQCDGLAWYVTSAIAGGMSL